MYYPVYWRRCVQKRLLPNALCHLTPTQPTLYLTFDDGPIPEVTPWVLDQLAQYKAKATFFCVGANVERHPHIYQRLLAEGHQVGNHTQNHRDGWKTSTADYLTEVANARKNINSLLFRPPYGRLTAAQSHALRQQGYQLVYWEILAGDFDAMINWQRCLKNVLKNAQSGSIVVLHDSLKAWPHVREVLPRLLAHYRELDYQLEALPKPLVPML